MSEIFQTLITLGISLYVIISVLIATKDLYNNIALTSITAVFAVIFTFLIIPTPIMWAISWGTVVINFIVWNYLDNNSVSFSAYKTSYNTLSKLAHRYIRRKKYALNYTENEYIEIASELKQAKDNIVEIISKLQQNNSLGQEHKSEVLKDLENINTLISHASAEFEIYMISDLGIDSMRNSELLNLWYPKSGSFDMTEFNKIYKPKKEKYDDGNYFE